MPLIRVSDETLKALHAKRVEGQSYNGLLMTMLSSPAPIQPVQKVPGKVGTSVDSLVLDFERDLSSEVARNGYARKAYEWCLSWWQNKLREG
jgi:hypothetical protein